MKKLLVFVLTFAVLASLTACSLPVQIGVPSAPATETPSQTTVPTPTDTPAVTQTPAPVQTAEPTPKPAPTPEANITATSDDLKVYIRVQADGSQYLVNDFGQITRSYSIDESGNILNSSGRIVILARNTLMFVPVSRIGFTRSTYYVPLAQTSGYVINSNQNPINQVLDIEIYPANATCRYLYLSSSDYTVAEFSSVYNARPSNTGDLWLPAGTIPVEIDSSGHARAIVTVKRSGQAKIYASGAVGDPTAECTIATENNEIYYQPSYGPVSSQVNASGNAENHTHVFTSTFIPPTTTDKGYTLYVCQECGYSYEDNFVSKLESVMPEEIHVHSYEEVVIPPTETTEGYTLHTCSCGDSYKDCFVPAIGG